MGCIIALPLSRFLYNMRRMTTALRFLLAPWFKISCCWATAFPEALCSPVTFSFPRKCLEDTVLQGQPVTSRSAFQNWACEKQGPYRRAGGTIPPQKVRAESRFFISPLQLCAEKNMVVDWFPPFTEQRHIFLFVFSRSGGPFPNRRSSSTAEDALPPAGSMHLYTEELSPRPKPWELLPRQPSERYQKTAIVSNLKILIIWSNLESFMR